MSRIVEGFADAALLVVAVGLAALLALLSAGCGPRPEAVEPRDTPNARMFCFLADTTIGTTFVCTTGEHATQTQAPIQDVLRGTGTHVAIGCL